MLPRFAGRLPEIWGCRGHRKVRHGIPRWFTHNVDEKMDQLPPANLRRKSSEILGLRVGLESWFFTTSVTLGKSLHFLCALVYLSVKWDDKEDLNSQSYGFSRGHTGV